MALDFLEGFDYYPDLTTAGIGFSSTWIGDAFNISLGTGRFVPGKAMVAGNNTGGRVVYRAITTTTKVTLGFALKADLSGTPAAGTPVISFQSTNGNEQFCIGYDNLGGIRVAQGKPGSLAAALAISGDKIVSSAWHYIEMELELSDTVGRVRVYLDGKSQYELTNIDTKASVDLDLGRITISMGTVISYSIDDMYVLYGEALSRGESRVQLLKPNADGTVAFTPNSGSNNFSRVNELPVDSDTTYNSSNTVNAEDLFAFEDITTNPEQIHAVEIVTACRKEDAGTRTMQNRLKSSATTVGGPNQNLITDYRWVRSVHELDPNGAIAWSKVGINAMQVGYKLIL